MILLIVILDFYTEIKYTEKRKTTEPPIQSHDFVKENRFMDTRQIEYILKIAEENNITRAAEKLFITQSALNQQLLKLEKDLEIGRAHV